MLLAARCLVDHEAVLSYGLVDQGPLCLPGCELRFGRANTPNLVGDIGFKPRSRFSSCWRIADSLLRHL